jgi:hypothetical protein
MPVPARKLRAFVEKESPKKKRRDEDDDEERDDESGEDEVDEAKIAKFVKEEGDRVGNGKQDKQLRKLMRNFDPEDNPPAWVTSEAKWERAKEAVDPEGEGAEKYDEPWAVTAHVYKRMGGGIKGKK